MTNLTTTEIAADFGTTPRELRKFLRADAKAQNAQTPGKGARYAIAKKDLRSLRTRFNAWNTPKADTAPATPESD